MSATMTSYAIGDIVVQSTLALPSIAPMDQASRVSHDVTIQRCSATDLGSRPMHGPMWWCPDPKTVMMEVPGEAVFEVRADLIRVAADSRATPESLARLVEVAAMPILFLLRGWLVVRGTVVALNGEGLLVTSVPGGGTSTVAAGMLARGFHVVADGWSAIGDGLRVCGLPALALHRDSAALMDSTDYDCVEWRSDLPRTLHRSRSAPPTAEIVLRAAYVLQRGVQRLASERVTSLQAIQQFSRSRRFEQLSDELGLAETHFRQVALLAGSVPVETGPVAHRWHELDQVVARVSGFFDATLRSLGP